MAYKPAYIVFCDGAVKVFAGNYEKLSEVEKDPDYPAEFFVVWWSQKDDVFYIRRRTEAEWKTYRREHRAG